MEEIIPGPQTYAALLTSIKERIQTAQARAALAVDRELGLALLGNRLRYSCPSRARRVGKEHHCQAGQRSEKPVPRDERFISPKPWLHEGFC